MTLYRIHWKIIRTSITGHGATEYPKKVALLIAAGLNLDNAGFTTHWIEPVPAATATETPTDKESTDN